MHQLYFIANGQNPKTTTNATNKADTEPIYKPLKISAQTAVLIPEPTTALFGLALVITQRNG